MNILEQFGVQPILLLAQIVNFTILLFILKRFLYKPILKVLETRRQKIEESLKNAEEIELQLQRTREQSEKIIAKALEESQKILDDTNGAANQILEDAHKASEQILRKATEDAKKFVELERERLKQEVRGNLGDILLLALQKVTGKVFTQKDQKQMIEETVKNLRA